MAPAVSNFQLKPWKATKFCKISTVDLTVTTQDKSKVVISQKLFVLLTKTELYQSLKIFKVFLSFDKLEPSWIPLESPLIPLVSLGSPWKLLETNFKNQITNLLAKCKLTTQLN